MGFFFFLPHLLSLRGVEWIQLRWNILRRLALPLQLPPPRRHLSSSCHTGSAHLRRAALILIWPNNRRAQVPARRLRGVERCAELVQQPGMCVEDDDVVNHHGDQHHHHLQLVVNPQKHRTRHQAQYTAVDEVLDTNSVKNLTKVL